MPPNTMTYKAANQAINQLFPSEVKYWNDLLSLFQSMLHHLELGNTTCNYDR